MRKSTIFISAVLTTFALVMLYAVVAAYRNMDVQRASALAVDTATAEPTEEIVVEPTATLRIITPEQAAQIAAQVVGNTNLLSAESSSINGLQAYLITFTNKDVVYVGLDGQVLAVQIAPVVVNVSVPVAAPQKNRNRNNNASSSTSSAEPHDSNPEHDD
jgi:hypothetical protein